jgi:peroxiredoxin
MPPRLNPGLVLIAVVALTYAVDAQEDATTPGEAAAAVPAPGHSIHGEAFDEGPRQAARLLPGMGKVHFPVTTPSAEAQRFVDQGVAQLHGFYYLEAERSFRQAARIDPDCALAHWGMAMANVNNTKRAKGFLAAAKEKAGKRPITTRERLHLDALAASHNDAKGVDDRARRKAYVEGLEAIVQEAPDDLDARAWLAMVTWQNAGKGDGLGSRQAVDALLDQVLAANPLHPGALHYRIHLWDGAKPARAELAAGLLAAAAPGIAHAWHMPGHTYTELKRYDAAAYQQEGSARVDHAMMARERVMPFEIHNYAHNNQWLATSLSHTGRARMAVAVARDLVRQPRDPQKNKVEDAGSAQRLGRQRWAEALTRYELWDDLIAATESGALDWSDLPAERVEKARSIGLARAGKGDQAGLASSIETLRAMRPKDKPAADAAKKTSNVGRGRAPSGLDSALAELEGHALALKGDIDGAAKRFEQAKSMRKDALARWFLAVKRLDRAESVAREAANRDVNQLPAQATLVEVLAARGKTAEAQLAYAALVPTLRRAEADLPIVQRLAAIASSWSSAGWSPPEPDASQVRPLALASRDLSDLGPLTWSPYPSAPIDLTDTDGKPWRLAENLRPGRNLVVLLYLGGQCAHCMQQLQDFGAAFDAFRDAGTDLVAVSTDDLATTRELKNNPDGVKFPMPLLADPGLVVFKALRSFDDFEGTPLHGTFLIDAAGGVRFHRIGPEPFLDVKFLRTEAARALRLASPG